MIHFNDLRVIDLTANELPSFLIGQIPKKPLASSTIISYLNAFSFYLLENGPPEYQRALYNSDHLICDGFGAQYLIRLAMGRNPKRVTYREFVDEFLTRLEKYKIPIFIIGHSKDELDIMIQVLKTRFAQLPIAGYKDGFFNVELDQAHLLNSVKNSGAQLIWLGMGSPKQEIFAYKLKNNLQGTLILNCGAALRHATGQEKTGPPWLTETGFEWLWRLYLEPKRLFLRTIKTNACLIYLILKLKLKKLWS